MRAKSEYPTVHGKQHLPGGSDPSTGDVTLNAIVDGSGNVITTGIKGDVGVHADYTIIGWKLMADVSGDVVMDIWRDSYANFPPDVSDSIVGSSPPTLSGQQSATDTDLDGWDTVVSDGDVFRFNVDSISAVSKLTLALTLRPR